MRKRGQSSGPIELVVAVIVMMASMGLAFMVFSNSESARCTNQLHAQIRGVEAALIDVALGSPSTTREVNLELGKCGDLNVEGVRVVYYSKPSFCQRCPSTGSGCWVLEPLTYSTKTQSYAVVGDAATCVNIPGQIALEVNDNQNTCFGESKVNQDACPLNAKDDASGENCGIPSTAIETANGPKVLTLSKTTSERQYKIRITKGYSQASGTPALSVCFQSKQDALEQERLNN